MLPVRKLPRYMFISLTLFINFCVNASDFVINLPQPVENNGTAEEVKSFFIDAYKSVDIKPSFIFTSSERGFKLLTLNSIQAEGYRASYVGDKVASKYKIKTPLSYVKVAVFCIKAESCNINSDLSYVIQTGFSFGQLICDSLNIKCKYEATPHGIAKLLDEGLVDGVISTYPAYSKYLCAADSDIFYYSGLSRFDFNIYHYTNVSDKKLRLAIEKGLKANLIKHSHLFEKYNQSASLEHCDKKLFDIQPSKN